MSVEGMGSWVRDRSLTLLLLFMFAVFALAQLATGFAEYNAEHTNHGQPPLTLQAYLGTGHPWEALFENWESEFLQMAVFVLLTTFLIQKGSPESRRPGVRELVDTDPRDFTNDPDAPWPVRRGGWVLRLYEHSLGLAFVLLFLVSWLGHALGGYAEYAADEALHGQPKQRYFTQDQLRRIIEAASGQYRVLFALLAGTGMRIGEAAGLHVDDLDLDNGVIYVHRSVWNGQELEPKTESAVREIDIDPALASLLREHIGESGRRRLFEARNSSPLSAGNIRNRVLHPLLAKLGLFKAGMHAFRHSRVTLLRKNGTPADLQRQWIGHSSLKTTDRYSHTDQELEYRRKAASRVGLDLIVGPKSPRWTQDSLEGGVTVKATW